MLRIIFLMLLGFNSYCLEVIPLTTASSDSSMAVDFSSPIGVPSTSKARFGTVFSKKIDNNLFNTAIFIIGADKASQIWLEQHQKQLQSLQAIGFITNVDNFDIVIKLQQQSQLPLLPVNVDPLMTFINEQHYPLVIAEGEVWQ